MKISEIQELIKFVAKAGVNEVEIENKDFKIKIKSDYLAKKKSNFKEEPTIIQQAMAAPVQQAMAAPVQMGEAQVSSAISENTSKIQEKEESNNYITVKAQMIGTFYRSSSPDKAPFVEVGDTIKEGDKICIIEAMKLFNDIESEVSGKVVKVLVDDATPIEFDQDLFLIDPS
jgi:acetyl-CoA carboxylase biotin carboxyl carrier protein